MREVLGNGIIVPILPISRLSIELPLYQSVSAGFPSPAEDYYEKRLDLNDYCIKNKAATFFIEVEGDSMISAGIYTGDILVVDRSKNPKSGDVVLACIYGEFTTKRLIQQGDHWYLKPENPKYDWLEIDPTVDFFVWGVVTYVVHQPYEL